MLQVVRNPRKLSRPVALAIFLVGIGYAFSQRSQLSTPPTVTEDASVWEQLFATPPVATLLRLVLVFTLTYFVASLAALVLEGRWIAKAGPGGAEADPATALDSIQAAGVELDKRVRDLEEAVQILATKVPDIDPRLK